MFRKFSTPIALSLCLLLLCSCREFRAIPGHGGGKRFSEEQRAVSKSIRAAIDDMDLKELKGKKVRVILQTISHSGGGTTRLPGWNSFDMRKSISRNLSGSIQKGLAGYTNLTDPRYLLGKDETSTGSKTNNTNYYDRENTNVSNNSSFNHGYRYQPNATINTHSVSTNSDFNYLNSILQMKCHHEGIYLTNKGDYLLYVLVDILGTNRSKNDLIAYTKEKLSGECEISYYTMQNNGKMLFKLRSAGAKSTYSEQAIGGFNISKPSYKLNRFQPDSIMSFGSKKELPEKMDYDLKKDDLIDVELKTNGAKKVDPDELANEIDNYIKEGNKESARVLYKKLIKSHPDHPRVEEFKASLEN
jgi:hypothetical protein